MSIFISQSRVNYLSPSQIVFERKLDTALRQSQLENMLKRIASNTPNFDDRLIVMSHKLVKSKQFSTRTDIVSQILIRILKGQYNFHSRNDISSRIKSLSCTNIYIQLQYSLTSYHLLNKSRIQRLLKEFLDHDIDSSVIKSLIDITAQLITTISNTTKLNIKPRDYNSMTLEQLQDYYLAQNHVFIKGVELTIIWSKRLVCFCAPYLNTNYILPRPCLLMLHNKLCDLLSILWLSMYTELSINPRSSFDSTCIFLHELCKLHIQYDHKYFKISKILEALCVGETLAEIESWTNKGFLEVLNEELFDDIQFDYNSSVLRQLFCEADIPMRHELSCLSKVLGHPIVDMEAGAKKIFDTANEQYTIDPKLINETICYIKENYIRTSIAVHGKWPPHVITSILAPTRIKQASVMGIDPNDSRLSKLASINIFDYNFVELLPNMKFHKLENTLPYLKDKTITLLRSKVIKKYIEGILVRTSWKETRLLIAYLTHPSSVMNHVEFMDNYTYSSNLDEFLDYLVIRIVPKEKELKVDFRGFGCKTYEDRLRALAQEKNVMKYLSEFSDEQAMTLSELDLAKRLYAFRTLHKAYTKHRIVYVNLDASSWNNHFRMETVDDMMLHTLDKIFDYPIFSKTHKAYMSTKFYVPDEEITYHWDGQAGGIEGLNQDTWVVVYINMIKTALSHVDYKYHILCKGDDFRLAIMIPIQNTSDNEISDQKRFLVSTISQYASKMGHKIKIEDSYGSEQYFTFSKAASINTIEMPQTYRKIQKCYGANNAFLSTFDEYIACAFSNAHSASRTAPMTLGCYMVALSWSYYYLLNDKYYTKLSDDQLVGCLLVPSVIGGFPIIYFHNMHTRAESDLFSPFLGLLEFCKQHYPNVGITMESFCKLSLEIPDSIVALLKDPYSLPIDRPSLPTTVLRSFVTSNLRKCVKNEVIVELLDAVDSNESELILNILKTSSRYSVKTLSIIYSALPAGVLEELIRKFESARSMNELLIMNVGRRKTNEYLTRVIRAESLLQKWRIQMIQDTINKDYRTFHHLRRECPAEYAFNIRQFAWGKPIDGITMPPIQHQIKYTTRGQDHANIWSLKNHFTYHLKHPTQFLTPDMRYQYASALERPFLGYTTRTGTLEPAMHFIEKDVLLLKLKNLLDILSWTYRTSILDDGTLISSNADKIIEKIIKLYTNIPLAELAPFSGQKKSGTEQHHIRSPRFRESIVPNVLTNIYQNVVGESNSHNTFVNSGFHYMVNFLHIYCYSVYVLQIELDLARSFTTPTEVWAVTTDCEFCTKPIEDYPLVFDLTHIDKVIFTPLQVMQIGNHAHEIIKISFQEFSARKYNVIGNVLDITVVTATIGILNEVVRHSAKTSTALHARYTTHHLNPEGRSILAEMLPKTAQRDIGLTEIKGLDVKTICVALSNVVFMYLNSKLSIYDQQDMLGYLRSIPSTELPWYGIVSQMYDTGKIVPVVVLYANVLEFPYIQISEDISQLVYYVGSLAFKYFLQNCYIFDIVITTNLEIHEINKLIVIGIIRNVWARLRKFNFPYIQECTEIDEKISELAFMYYMVWIVNHLSALTLNIDNITESCNVIVMNIFTDEIDDLMDESNFVDYEEFKLKCGVLGNQISRLFPCKFIKIYNYITENFQAITNRAITFFDKLVLDIQVTTLQCCISTIRSMPKNINVFIKPENTSWLHNSPNFLIPAYYKDMFKFPKCAIETTKYRHTYNFNVFPNHKIRIRTEYLHRIFGCGTTSMTSMILILKLFKIEALTNRKHLNITVLGDGMGSFTTVLAFTFPESNFIFNTKRRSKHIITIAELPLINPTHRAYINTDTLNSDIWDITDPVTHLEHEKVHPMNHIVACDAEYDWNHILNWYEGAVFTFQYFLRTGTTNSVLIIRIYNYNTTHVSQFLSYVSSFNLQYILYQPENIRCHLAAYLICILDELPSVKPEYNLVVHESISISLHNIYQKFLNECEDRHIKADNSNKSLLPLNLKVAFLSGWRTLLPGLWFGLYLHHAGIDISEEQFKEHMCENTLPRQTLDIIKSYDFRYKQNINHLESVLKTDFRNQRIQANLDLNTHASRVFKINQLFTLYGFSTAINQFQKFKLESFNVREAREEFLNYLNKLNSRDFKLSDMDHTIYTKKATDSWGTPIKYYENYAIGCNIALSMLGYIKSTSWLYKPHYDKVIDMHSNE